MASPLLVKKNTLGWICESPLTPLFCFKVQFSTAIDRERINDSLLPALIMAVTISPAAEVGNPASLDSFFLT